MKTVTGFVVGLANKSRFLLLEDEMGWKTTDDLHCADIFTDVEDAIWAHNEYIDSVSPTNAKHMDMNFYLYEVSISMSEQGTPMNEVSSGRNDES